MVTQAIVALPRGRQVRPATEAADWLKPSPLWQFATADYRQTEFFQPAILEFASDDFMTEFLAIAQAEDADSLRTAIAQPSAGQPLKLFQPLHGRFYLVCASLACRIPGFPDRRVDLNQGESVFFVLRRVIDGREYAWVGPEGKRTWQSTDSTPRRVLDGEERLPVSPASMASGRSLQFGYLPVSSGETYRVPAAELVEGNEPPPDVRVEEFGSRFSAPLTGPIDAATQLPDFTRSAIYQTRDEQSRLSSVYLLLEGWEYFLEHMPDVAAVVGGESGAALAEPNVVEKQALLDHLEGMDLTASLDLLQALQKAAQQRETLNQDGGVQPGELDGLGFTAAYDLKHHPVSGAAMLTAIDKLRAALPGEPPQIALPKLTPRTDAEYVVRMVYERAQCDPVERTISLPSRVFRLAPFFDPDAPARQIKIALPADVSVAGLRKFKPGVTFMLSESMQRKMESLTGKERDLLKDENTSLDEGAGVAWICSFSIQIIFIVAFMLMIMFVFILNIVFWWIFFFRICLPIPKSLLPK